MNEAAFQASPMPVCWVSAIGTGLLISHVV